MDKKKLLVFHPTLAPYRIDYFNALNKRFNMKLIFWNKGNVNQSFNMESLYAKLDFKPEFRTERYGLYGLKQRKGIMSAMKEFKPDVILSCECGPVTMMAITYKNVFDKKCKVVTMVDDSFDMLSGGQQVERKHALAEKLVLPFVDNIICVDSRVTKIIKQRYGKGATMPIIYEEDTAIYKYKKLLPLADSFINKYSLEGKKVILYVGRLAPEKNIATLIKAFLKIENPDVKLVIIGSGPLEEELNKQASHNPNIIFTGRLEGDEVYAWYNVAQVFILPSILEPFGAVTNEALLAGCYSLVSSKAGSSYLITEDENGNIINPFDEEDIRQKLTMAIDKTNPLSLPLKLKQNKMTMTFNECFNQMTETVF